MSFLRGSSPAAEVVGNMRERCGSPQRFGLRSLWLTRETQSLFHSAPLVFIQKEDQGCGVRVCCLRLGGRQESESRKALDLAAGLRQPLSQLSNRHALPQLTQQSQLLVECIAPPKSVERGQKDRCFFIRSLPDHDIGGFMAKLPQRLAAMMAVDDLEIAGPFGVWPDHQRLIPSRSLDVVHQFGEIRPAHRIGIVRMRNQPVECNASNLRSHVLISES
jgi:hypothetical protein